jgi:spore coat polysaccharide biosynthesis protein SpsF
VGNLRRAESLGHLRWTVDEPADFNFVERVYEALYPLNPGFATADVLALLASHPELAGINTGITRNEGLQRSLERDPQAGS